MHNAYRWNAFYEELVSTGAYLTRKLGYTRPPIPIKEILNLRHIKKVVFQPLLVDGGLAISGNHFVVYVNCKKESAHRMIAQLNDEKDQGRYLPSRTRFTIAHEIAHTFFFNKSGLSLVSRNSMKYLRKLELSCNEIASHLLIPRHLLKEYIERKDLLSPQTIIQIAKDFNVSTEVLIKSLIGHITSSDSRGIVMTVRDSNEGLRISAIASHHIFSRLVPKVVPPYLNDVLSHSSEMINEWCGSEEVYHSNKTNRSWKVSWQQFSIKPRSFIVTLTSK